MIFRWYTHKHFILIAILIVMVTTGASCTKGGALDAQRDLDKAVTIEVWGVFDSSRALEDVIARYTASRINVRVNYRKLQFSEYQTALLEAWAEGRGPDVFMVHNTWVGDYINKISPAPAQVKVAAAYVTGGYNKKVEAYYDSYAGATIDSIRNDFVGVVAQDAVRDGKVYGLPLSVDTLALYYNRSLLDQAGIPAVPKTWQEIKLASQALTILNDNGEIIRSGIALGGAENINRSFDILSLLMAQNGTVFVDSAGLKATFAQSSPYSIDRSYKPGQAALQFYSDFANPAKEVYTWSEDFPSAQEQFVGGSLGMMLGYSYQLAELRVQGPRLNIGVAPVPHINADGSDATGETINWANYWLYSVAQSSDVSDHAWDFIHYMTTRPDVAKLYLEKNQRPTALRSLIAEQQAQPELGVFASQLLTARSWYTGLDAPSAEAIFKNMITQVATNKATAKETVERAESLVTQTLYE